MTPHHPRALPPYRQQVAGWKSLYLDGFTIRRISEDAGVPYNRIRDALLDAGVALRKQGGRGSIRSSILVRVAELEREVRRLATEVDRITERDAEPWKEPTK